MTISWSEALNTIADAIEEFDDKYRAEKNESRTSVDSTDSGSPVNSTYLTYGLLPDLDELLYGRVDEDEHYDEPGPLGKDWM